MAAIAAAAGLWEMVELADENGRFSFCAVVGLESGEGLFIRRAASGECAGRAVVVLPEDDGR